MNSILIVDDDPFLLEGMRRIARRRYKVVTADNGAEALRLLKEKGPFSAVVSDMNMQGMNGLDFLEKALALSPDTPRVMLTGYVNTTVLSESINRASVFRFLEKPVSPDAFLACIDECAIRYRDSAKRPAVSPSNSQVDWIRKELETVNFDRDFELYYQPRVGSVTESLHGVEALLRWKHPKYGMITPANFIPVAEEGEVIEDITDWVLQSACRTIRDWKRNYNLTTSVSVNIAPSLIEDQSLPEMVQSAISRFGIEPSLLELEITEGAALDDDVAVLNSISSLKALGAKVSIDDFGAGHTSMRYLQFIDVDCVKIDRRFVTNSPVRQKDKEILRAVASLTRALGIKIVAEGIEDSRHVEVIRELGIDEMQGYHYARPMTGKNFLAWEAGRPGSFLQQEPALQLH